ncbi:14670_t:CDS:2 [Acaulospora colombiana]|uniref:14670_t:CDS:1 n=1 Tax=Acaulospora colombiana TaxID=27376 RepID=A0ACA9NC64_9GLOM|nr:14670_t:CDS:2 [Acaulospora colombiana]
MTLKDEQLNESGLYVGYSLETVFWKVTDALRLTQMNMSLAALIFCVPDQTNLISYRMHSGRLASGSRERSKTTNIANSQEIVIEHHRHRSSTSIP